MKMLQGVLSWKDGDWRGYRSIEIMSSFNQAVFSQMDPKYFQLLKSHYIVFTIMWSDTEEGLNHRYFTLYHYCSFLGKTG